MNSVNFIALEIAIAAAVVAAATDLRSFRIPNLLTFPLLATGILYHAVMNGVSGVMLSVAGALIGIILLFPLYAVGGMGAGDIKLVAGLGAWLGPLATCQTLFVACLLTAMLSFVLKSLWRRQDVIAEGERIPRVDEVNLRPHRRRRLIPFGVSVALGLLATLTWNQW